ncbi:Uncharacterized protein Adt_12421 [Abeliophyllum distichum]|uniref:Uncharacterized protein n=1 Tax=Abeliophyllum distichum TaxID=126358 RepID=A0ABD1UQN7_9LAMI
MSAPSSSPSKSPPRTRRSTMASLQSSSPPAQTGIIKGASNCKRPASDPSEQSNDNDDDDAPIIVRMKKSFISPSKALTPLLPSSPPSSVPSNEEILPEEELKGQEYSIAQPVGELLPFQGVDPPRVEPEETPIDLPVVKEPAHPDKRKSSQVVELPSDILHSSSSKVADEEQVKAGHASRSSSANHPSVSAAFSIDNMNILNHAVLEYTSIMDMVIVKTSATSQQEKFERLSNKMAQALELPSLNLLADIKLSLKIIHHEISSLLAKNVELKVNKTQYVLDVNEKECLHHEIEKAKSSLNEISSNVMVEDSLMMSLAAVMKELQAKMDNCKARLAAKKCNASQEVKRTKSLLKRYSNLEVDEEIMVELSNTSIDQRDKWKKLREHAPFGENYN